MKLFLDDMRDAPDDSWTVIRKVEPAIKFIHMFGKEITEFSLDHDIENRPDDETFLPVAFYIGERYASDAFFGSPPKVTIHSLNPVGAKRLQEVLKEYEIEAPYIPYAPALKALKEKFGDEIE